MIEATANEVVAEPFPHVIRQPFLDPELYKRLRDEFPPDQLFERDVSIGGRSGRDIYRGDAEMDELLQTSPAWSEFHGFINSDAYLRKTLDLFGDYLEDFDCRVRRDEVRFTDFTEPREDLLTKNRVSEKVAAFRNRKQAPSDLYARLDIHQGAVAYGKKVHCDRPNRFVSMIVYFSDAAEIECDGGSLGIHEHTERKPYRKYERHPREENTNRVATVVPKHNLGVFFLCTNNSYHSVDAVRSQAAYRDFIYVNLSSRRPGLW